MKNKISEYEQQAIDFAEKCKLTMNAVYIGHYSRFEKSITANYKITLSRNGKQFSFDFSTSINDSWRYSENGKISKGLPLRIDTAKFFESYFKNPIIEYRGMRIKQCKKTPSLYDVLACLTKNDPDTFDNFCSEYGYDNDSISAMKTWQAVTEEYREVDRMFKDIMEELQEIQ